MESYLNAKAFIARLERSGFAVSAAAFSKLKQKGVLPPPDARIGPSDGWLKETVDTYVRRLTRLRRKIENTSLEAKGLDYWIKVYGRRKS